MSRLVNLTSGGITRERPYRQAMLLVRALQMEVSSERASMSSSIHICTPAAHTDPLRLVTKKKNGKRNAAHFMKSAAREHAGSKSTTRAACVRIMRKTPPSCNAFLEAASTLL